MTKSLQDAEKPLSLFIAEARKCVENDCGFAAMLTIFPVVFSVTESVHARSGLRCNDKDAHEYFAHSTMFWKFPWLKCKLPTDMDDVDPYLTARILIDTYVALWHIALPKGVCLIGWRNNWQEVFDTTPNINYAILVSSYIDAVEEWTQALIKIHGEATFDPWATSEL